MDSFDPFLPSFSGNIFSSHFFPFKFQQVTVGNRTESKKIKGKEVLNLLIVNITTKF
ncbi:unnamed protein product [Amaranthus hypochondriacus]